MDLWSKLEVKRPAGAKERLYQGRREVLVCCNFCLDFLALAVAIVGIELGGFAVGANEVLVKLCGAAPCCNLLQPADDGCVAQVNRTIAWLNTLASPHTH